MTTEQATSFELRLRAMVVVAAHHHFQNPVPMGWRRWVQWIAHPNARCEAMAACRQFELLATVQALYIGVDDNVIPAHINVLRRRLREGYEREMR